MLKDDVRNYGAPGMSTNTDKDSRLLRDFGIRLRAARITAGYASGAVFAREANVEGATYRKYERGEANPPLKQLVKFSELTGKSVHFLVTGRSCTVGDTTGSG